MVDPPEDPRFTYARAGIVRGPLDRRALALCYSAHEYGECLEEILTTLAASQSKASFFFTGHFLRQPEFEPQIRRLVAGGHYLGPHSDQHLLYCDWAPDRATLVTPDQLLQDLDANLRAIAAFGVPRKAITHYIPPYEHYNPQIVQWCRAAGLTVVNYTPGTLSAADWTPEDFPRYRTTDEIYASIYARESEDPYGLNGFLLLMHAGAGPGRPDKSSRRLGELLAHLQARGYDLVRLDQLLLAP